MERDFVRKLEDKACELRNLTLNMCIKSGTGHVTSSMSCAEIFSVLYSGGIVKHSPKNPGWDGRDRFILSKGQASPILYATLADAGYFPKSWLNSFNKKNGRFGVHLQNDIPGVEFTTGSLGHGLGLGVGKALAARLDRKDYHTFVLLGDAELQEGSCWESVMFASQEGLDSLIGIIDRNGYGVLCSTEKSAGLEPLEDKFNAFGWETQRVCGHSVEQLFTSLSNAKSPRDKPLMIIADTIKGKGVDSWENVALTHGIAPKGDEAEKLMDELSNHGRYCDGKRCGVYATDDLNNWKCPRGGYNE